MLLLCAAPARAELTVLIGEPFGSFGTMMPVGHAAIYLDRVCADGPMHLRMCQPNEPHGVVIARYHHVLPVDWIATPVLQFFYATDNVDEIPKYATPAIAWSLRERYRQRYLLDLVPDGNEKTKLTDEWWETAGNAYNRKFWGYQIATTEEQDEAFVKSINSTMNLHRYRLNNHNCADFAAKIVNMYFPGAVRRDHIADYGWMTPKQVARSVSSFAKAHPEIHLQVIEVPQVPGSLRRSRPVWGASEGLLKTKRYLATLLVTQPEIVAVSAVLYLDHGRWTVGQGAQPVTAQAFLQSPASSTVVASAETGSHDKEPADTKPHATQ